MEKKISQLLICFLVVFFSLTKTQVHAQLIGGEAFLKGTSIEVGIAACGSYGTADSSVVPAGYHNTMNNNAYGLGFVADAQQDGWNTGTPGFCGDYFVPGSPTEGFCIEMGGVNYCNMNGSPAMCSSNDIPGAIISCVDTGNVLSVCWSGTVNGLRVDQTTYFFRDSLFFITQVSLTNTTGGQLDSVYYMRNLDPDNEEVATFSYSTDNSVIDQNPHPSNIALVTANGATTGCFLGLGSLDSRARVTYGGFFNTDASDVYDATAGLFGTGVNYTCDCAISLSFYFGDIPGGVSVSSAFAYILNQNQVGSALIATGNSIMVDTTSISANDSVYFCEGDSVNLSIVHGEYYTWVWSPATFLSTDTGSVVIAFPPATQTFTVTGTSVLCDTKNFTLTLEVTSPDYTITSADTFLCAGETLLLHASIPPPSTYLWSTGSINDSITVATTNTYWVDMINPVCNATSTDTTHVIFIDVPLVVLGNDTALCPDTIILDSGSPQSAHLWSTGATTQKIEPTTSGIYFVDVRNGRCFDQDTIEILFYSNPEVYAGEDKEINRGDTVAIYATGASSYKWSPETDLNCSDCNPAISSAQNTIQYVVVGTDINGCVDSDSMRIKVNTEETFFIPTAFSPNGDGFNQFFKVYGQFIADGQMFIYNRWGEELFATKDIQTGWDGSFHGQELPMGYYIYVINGRWKSGSGFSQTGAVSLIK